MTIRTTLASLVPLLWAATSWAQPCTAGMTAAPDSRWSAVPSSPGTLPDAPLKPMAHLRCTGCRPEVSVLVTAGPASPALQTMPSGRKVGLEWARAVVDDPGAREGFRQSVLRSELRSSPGCRLQGRVNGIADVGNLGTIATAIQAECAQGTARLSGEIYSAYDYTCEYQVQVVWDAGPLSPASRTAAGTLLKSIRFGP